MDETKFITALDILHDKNKEAGSSDYTRGYSSALYDVLQASKLCREPIENKDI